VLSGLLDPVAGVDVCDILRTLAVRCFADLRRWEEVSAPLAGRYLSTLVVVGQDVETGPARQHLRKLLLLGLRDGRPADGDGALAGSGNRQSIDIALEEEDAALERAGDKQRLVAFGEFLALG
jgi:hypothetical protein